MARKKDTIRPPGPKPTTKALARFRSCGWVRTGRRSITVLDVEALRARAS